MSSEHLKLLYKCYDNDDKVSQTCRIKLVPIFFKKNSEVIVHSIPIVTSEVLKDMPVI